MQTFFSSGENGSTLGQSTKTTTLLKFLLNDFLKACKKELSSDFKHVSVIELSLSITAGGPSLCPDLLLTDIPSQPDYFGNDDENPLFISIENIPDEDIIGSRLGNN